MKNGKLLSVIASLGVISSVFSAVPFAAGAVSSDEITFDKYLVMENEATVPNVSFGFEVSPIEDSETKAATDDTLAVFKGDANIKFKSGDDLEVDENNDKKVNVSFKNTDSAQREAEAGDRSIEFKTSDTDDEKFAEKSIILDLKDVNFTAAGVYRYKLTETRDENIAGVEGNDVTRYLDIFVGNDSENNLAVLGYFIHTGDSAPKSGAVDSSGKSSGFCNYYVSNDLAFHKEVTGNQGSKDKYFKFTVQLTNADNLTVNDEDTFKLSGSWDKDPSPKTAVDVYSADVMKTANNRTEVKYSELKNGYSFYVRSGDNIQINGIPSGVLTAVASSVGIAVIGLIGVVVGIFCMKKKKTEEK